MPEKLQQGWHWPNFGVAISNELSERELLGLSTHFIERRFDRSMFKAFAELRSESLEALMEIAESIEATLEYRICAGNIIGLLGDPRIDPLQPNMLVVPGANVEIGLDESEVELILRKYECLGLEKKWIEKESPKHTVKLNSYAISKFPVTNSEYRFFLLDTAFTELPTSWEFGMHPLEKANHPVYTVSSHAAETYVTWLSEKTGRCFRLPTEAEWEYAAAGPQALDFPWGNQFEIDMANTAETGLFSTSPVGIFTAGNSHFGLADMAGNVEEYVADNYAPYAQGKFVKDHLAELNGEYRVARGGSFARFRDLARTRRRHGRNAMSKVYAMGFRIVESL